MTEIVLVKQDRTEISEADKAVVRRVLFGQIDGLSQQHQKSWRRLIGWFLTKAQPGEMVEIKTHRERLGWYHRKHMLLESRVFQAQERFAHFEQFRLWLKTGAGFVDWLPGPKGGVIPVPRSISYAKLEQDDMERVHNSMVEFLRTGHAGKCLWPHASVEQRIGAIEFILAGLDE